MSNEVEKTMDVDPGMNEDPRGTKEIDEEEVIEEKLACDLITGQSLITNIKTFNWRGIISQKEPLEENIITLKQAMYELVTTKPEDRLTMVVELIKQLEEQHRQFCLDLNYNIREGLTEYERALLMCMNLIIVTSDMISNALICGQRECIEDLEDRIQNLEMVNAIQNTSNELDEIDEEIENKGEDVDNE
jgi:hypothetical protein